MLFLLSLTLLGVDDGRPASPADAVGLALKDAKTIGDARRIRYLWMPGKTDPRSRPAVSGHVNQLSTESDLVPVRPLDGTRGTLARVNLDDYGWGEKTWEQLADQEPYFHVTVTTVKFWDGFKWNPHGPGERRETTTRVAAPWLLNTPERLVAIGELVTLTGSQVPIVRADWFVYQTAAQVDRRPGYYDFLGIKNLDDFKRIAGYSKELAEKTKHKELLEAVAQSRVSQAQARRIGGFPTISRGLLWMTFDSKVSTDKNNPLRVLTDELKFDGHETIGTLPNGMRIWGAFNAQGGRLDNAPDFVGADKTSSSLDLRIHPGISCCRCHYRPENGAAAGLQEIREPWVRGLFRAGGPAELRGPIEAVTRDLRQKYLRDLIGVMEDDRRVHSRAVLTATGLEPGKWSDALSWVWENYESPRGLADAAADLGVKTEELGDALHAMRRAGTLDLVGAALLDGRKIGIKQHEESLILWYNAMGKK